MYALNRPSSRDPIDEFPLPIFAQSADRTVDLCSARFAE